MQPVRCCCIHSLCQLDSLAAPKSLALQGKVTVDCSAIIQTASSTICT
jgi:hypothetical protein